MTTWQRIDGSVLGDGVDVTADSLAVYFREHGVLAVVDRYPATPQLMGLRVLGDADGRVAMLAGETLASGLEIQELAEDIAVRFDVDVLLGDVTVEEDEWMAEAAGESEQPEEDRAEEYSATCADGCTCGPECECCGDHACDCGDADCSGHGASLRAVTITSGTDDEMPALARAVGEPVTVVRDGAHQIVLTEPGGEVPGVQGWDPDLLPVVQILAHEEDRTLVVQTDLASATVTWGSVRIVAAPEHLSSEQEAALAQITSDEDDARLVASATADADLALVRATLAYAPKNGPRALLEALGLSPVYADFLDGVLEAEEIPGARLVEPVRPSDLIRTTLVEAVEDVTESRPVEFVAEIEQEWPTLIRSLSMGKGMAGAALMVMGLRSRRGWGKAGAIAGAALVVYSFADVALYEWLRRRREAR